MSSPNHSPIGAYFMFEKISKFCREVVKEMKLVNWPSKHDIKEGTVVVIVMSAIVGVFLSIVDYIFTFATKFLY
jgi:preprotein translocase subunit SecE